MAYLPSPPPPANLLGCAQTYTAAIHTRGGASVYVPGSQLAEALTGVDWERRLMETSTASVVLAKRQLARECCQMLGTVEPWCHELSVYRDEALVWQGPVLKVNEAATTITVTARDVSSWLAKLVNTRPTHYPNGRDVALIAQDVILNNLQWAKLASPNVDWPALSAYLYRVNAGVTYKLSRAGSIWTDTVMTIVQDMADRGFEWTTLGRRLVMRPGRVESIDRARARLTPEHLPGGISVVKDGDDAATHVWATSQSDNDPGVTVVAGLSAAQAAKACGRLDMLVRSNPRIEVESEAAKTKRLEAIAKRRDDKITAERNQAEKDLDVILAGPNDVAERQQAERRRKLRDTRIDTYRKDYEKELAASNAKIAALVKAKTAESLLLLARKTLRGRWPVPAVIAIPANTALSPDAPITVDDLVCGERIDVAAVGFCREVTQAMKLTQVRGTWGQQGESISVSLTPLTDIVQEV